MSANSKRDAVDRMAARISKQENISHHKARSIVVKHITRAEQKKRS